MPRVATSVEYLTQGIGRASCREGERKGGGVHAWRTSFHEEEGTWKETQGLRGQGEGEIFPLRRLWGFMHDKHCHHNVQKK